MVKDIVVVVGFSRMINSALHYEEVNSVQKEHLNAHNSKYCYYQERISSFSAISDLYRVKVWMGLRPQPVCSDSPVDFWRDRCPGLWVPLVGPWQIPSGSVQPGGNCIGDPVCTENSSKQYPFLWSTPFSSLGTSGSLSKNKEERSWHSMCAWAKRKVTLFKTAKKCWGEALAQSLSSFVKAVVKWKEQWC